MTLTEWLRILMLGPDSDASEETVQQVAAFLQEEEGSEDEVWVPEVLCGETAESVWLYCGNSWTRPRVGECWDLH